MTPNQLLERKLAKDMSYGDLRRTLLAEGWAPLADSTCKGNVGGEALICNKITELQTCSSDGHCVMNFTHEASTTSLRVNTYGDYADWNVIGPASKLAVTGWTFAGAESDAASPRGDRSPGSKQTGMGGNDLPISVEACTLDGHAAFFESYVRSETTRASYTASQVQIRDVRKPSASRRMIDRYKYGQFNIGLMDYRWVYLDPAKDQSSYERLSLKQERTGGNLRVDYVKAEFDADDNLIRTYGDPGAYVFEFKQGCWYLTQDLQ